MAAPLPYVADIRRLHSSPAKAGEAPHMKWGSLYGLDEMSIAAVFRANAAKERAAALLETLPNRRKMRERSAMRWEEMAQTVEDHEQLTIRNASAKAEREKSVI
jgi:hypothetical protein